MFKKATSSISPWQWADQASEARYGDGVSRPMPGVRTQSFTVHVKPRGAGMVIWETKAEDVESVIRYANSRWPGAEVEVM